MSSVPKGCVFGRESLLRLLAQTPPLVEGLYSPDQQVQPNGIDITVREVAAFRSAGRMAADSAGRLLSEMSPLAWGADGWIALTPGPYLVTFNEIVHLPRDVTALGKPRSSLLRCGVAVHNAVWDAGYSGRSQALLVVYNPQGFRLERNARVLQLVFLVLTEEVAEGYRGRYQGENMDSSQ
ncbi:MAG: deoxyuridine 5'-triphosphate nucleotidohydrolase [Chloroflexi bacterium]|nr:deoxyuridine 5'-triphosphate nucleotidohydrolase [Chloroflexota bacterium]